MTPERWQQIRDLLAEALELTPEQQTAFLERTCASDSDLRKEVETLLASSDHVRSSFLESPPPRLARISGTMLGEYEIRSLLGAGGMGEVYRARDARLHRDVAIKVLPHFFSADPGRLRRFEQEARAAAALNHPNILAVFQMGAYEGTPYLVSELLEGETLREKIECGRLTLLQSVDFGMQVAHGLLAAHEKGIVHRDLKPENLFVTRDGRIKVLDFGLAKLTQMPTAAESGGVSIATEAGLVMGTVGYMSPEQVRGQLTDNRTDIFAFGAIFHEMLTGKRAFHKATAADTMSAVLNEDPPSVSDLNPAIPSSLAQLVGRCLGKNPELRFQSISELLPTLDALSHKLRYPERHLNTEPATALPASISSGGRRVTRRHILPAMGALIVLFLIAVAVWQVRRTSLTKLETTANKQVLKSRRSIAVLEIRNLSGKPDQAWLETALPEMLTTELAAGEQLRTVSGEDVAKMKANLSLPPAGSYGKTTLARIRRSIGADEIVVGSYVPVEAQQMRVDLRLQDTKAGETSEVLSATGSVERLDELVNRLGSTLREKLGVPQIPGDDLTAVRAMLPQKPSTEELYSEGLRLLRLYQFPDAMRALEKAVAAEPNYPLAHSALASAYRGLGVDARAREEIKKAFDLSAGLPREKRLWIEAQFYSSTNDWAKAIQSYRTLFEFFPDNLEYGLRLASAQTSSGNGKDSLATVDLLRKLPLPDSDNPIIDLTESVAAGSLGDFKREHEAAARSVEKADSEGARLLAAQARIADCSALHDLGRPDEALTTCEKAKSAFQAAGDRGGAARAMTNMGVLYQEAGELTKARQVYEDALAAVRMVGNERVVGILLNNLGEIQRAQGDLEDSVKTQSQVKVISHEIGLKRFMAYASFDTGIAHAAEGKLKEARKDYSEALKTMDETGDKSGRATVLFLLGDLDLAADNLASAQKNYAEALSIRTAIGESRTIPESQMALANLLVEEKHLPQAEVAAAKSATALQQVHSNEEAAVAFSVLARVQREQGKIDDARAAIVRAAQLLQKDGDMTARLRVKIEAAREQAASGKSEDLASAAHNLRDLIDQASRKGLVGWQLEARLALAEIASKTPDFRTARMSLIRLEREAKEKSFLLVARKARQTSGDVPRIAQ